jgi:hypothetical protein
MIPLRWREPLFLIALLLLFLVANRAAYKSYFSDDDLDNLSWTNDAGPDTFSNGFITWRTSADNFRPTGHFVYRVLGQCFGTDFRPFVAFIQIVHLLNGALLWGFLRRMGSNAIGRCAGVGFFLLHMALFAAFWKPMYVFDLLCGFFLLLTLHAYLGRFWWLGLPSFWLAYKAKEVAILFPVVLMLIELLPERRRWWKPLPFLLISLSFGLQALQINRGRNSDYSLRFTVEAFLICARFYLRQIVLTKWGWLALLPALWWVRDRRLWLGVSMLLLLLGPMFFLPARLFSVYAYVPFLGLSLGVAAIAERLDRRLLPVLMLAWVLWNYQTLRSKRNEDLYAGMQNKAFVAQIVSLCRAGIGDAVFYENAPANLHSWGVSGALRHFCDRPFLKVEQVRDTLFYQRAMKENIPVLSWDEQKRVLHIIRTREGSQHLSWLDFRSPTAAWQLHEGWFPLERDFRWMEDRGRVRIHRPAGSSRFVVMANLAPGLINEVGPVQLEILFDGVLVGKLQFHNAGHSTGEFTIPAAGKAGDIDLELRTKRFFVAPGDGRRFGIAIRGMGFR